MQLHVVYSRGFRWNAPGVLIIPTFVRHPPAVQCQVLFHQHSCWLHHTQQWTKRCVFCFPHSVPIHPYWCALRTPLRLLLSPWHVHHHHRITSRIGIVIIVIISIIIGILGLPRQVPAVESSQHPPCDTVVFRLAIDTVRYVRVSSRV